jgi:fumarate hydratase class II
MSKHRIETDTMGQVEVPVDAYYGAQTERARRNFAIGSGGLPRPLIRALGLLKGAAAKANVDLGLLDPEIGAAIQRAAEEVAGHRLDEHFVVDVFQTGSGTSSNMNANEVIANRASELLGQPLGGKVVHPNDHVNRCQSSNDVFPSAVQLALALVLTERLLPALRRLADDLHAFADRTFDDVKTGRTHLMDAMPIRFGQEFRGYGAQVDRAVRRIGATIDGLSELPIGGTAVGTGVNAAPGFASAVCRELAARTGHDRLRETSDHFQAQSCLDPVVDAHGQLRGFASALYKIANDLRWMASGPLNGLAELELPAVQPGSSIMPAKVNPVICEAVLMICGQVLANDVAVTFGNSQGQFELNTMMPMIARNAIESAVILAGACEVLRERCLDGATLTGVAGERVGSNPMLATALNDEIGYEAAAAIAKEAAASGRSVREVARERTSLEDAALDALLQPARLCGQAGKARTR